MLIVNMISNLTWKLEQSGKLNEMTADGVEAEMQEVKAELEMNLATNGNVLEQFQRRKAEVSLFSCNF